MITMSINEKGEIEPRVTTTMFKKEWKAINLFKLENDIKNIPLATRLYYKKQIDEALAEASQE